MITRGNLERLTQKFINEAFIHMQNEKPTARAEGAPSQDTLLTLSMSVSVLAKNIRQADCFQFPFLTI